MSTITAARVEEPKSRPVEEHRKAKAQPYAVFTARALVRCSELRLEFLRQCDASLFNKGRAETVLVELHMRRTRLEYLSA